LALTFDDGPSPEVTPRVLDILDAHHAKATFFVIGNRVPGNEALLRRMYASGYEIGNHTWDHHKPSELSPQDLEDEVSRTQQIVAASGAPAPKLFRSPYGEFDPMIRNHVSLTVIAWNIDPEDWHAKKPQQIVDAVLSHAKPGGIVDLHDIHPLTADALDQMLTGLEQQYHLVTVSELLNLSPGQPGVFYGR
jgi:peptidoglycan/xylan/chitin deacetylase (PgdA/CDA1 family)